MGISKKGREIVLNSCGSFKLPEEVSGVLTTNRKIVRDPSGCREKRCWNDLAYPLRVKGIYSRRWF
jgi:hypothetical protein